MCIEKKHFAPILLSAIAFAIAAQTIHTLGAIFTMDYYLNPAYFGVWSKLMMPTAGPPPLEFFYTSVLFGFISALIYAGAYSILHKSIPGKTQIKKGLYYGAILFALAAIPGALSMFLLINLPPAIILSWALENLAAMLAGGMIIARLIK